MSILDEPMSNAYSFSLRIAQKALCVKGGMPLVRDTLFQVVSVEVGFGLDCCQIRGFVMG